METAALMSAKLRLQEQAVGRFPRDARHRETLGLTRFRLRDYAGAARDLSEAFALDPKGFRSFVPLAQCHLENGAPKDALTICRKAADAGNDTAQLHAASARGFAALGRHEEYLAAERRVVERCATAGWAAEHLLRPAAMRGDGAALSTALESLPPVHYRGPVGRAYRAVASGLLGRRDEAMWEMNAERFTRRVALEPPAEFGGAARFHALLAEEILAREDYESREDGQWRRVNRLSGGPGRAFPALAALVQPEIERYRREWDSFDPDPLPVPDDYDMDASGLVFTGPVKGRPHIHNHSAITAVYHVAVPDNLSGRDGQLALGECGRAAGPAGPVWDIRHIEAIPGMLTLFPAFLFHAVRPVNADRMRISITFDTVPRDLEQL